MDTARMVAAVLSWYDTNARDLPWRRPEATPWHIMVSEFMLQQTPVARVLQPWHDWVRRWPSPVALAETPVGEAVRQWGRLGYPRRAVRLHQAAVTITKRHGGDVPADRAELASLPGVGSYTVAAILSFAYGQRHVVLDTNVRRVLTRAVLGEAFPPASSSAREVQLATDLLPTSPSVAARWAAASMELGAVVCTARSPRCPCARSSRCARGARRVIQPGTAHPDVVRPMKERTVSAAVHCLVCSAHPCSRCPVKSWTSRGPIRPSASGHSPR